jgi:hypothetical protein
LESNNDFVKYVGNCQNLDKVQNAEYVHKHFVIASAKDNFLQIYVTIAKTQNEVHTNGNYAHGDGSVKVEEHHQKESDDYRRYNYRSRRVALRAVERIQVIIKVRYL